MFNHQVQKHIFKEIKKCIPNTKREKYTLEKIEKYMDKYGLIEKGWRFTLDNPKSRAGKCNYNLKIITISKHFINNRETIRKSNIKNTILHEIAHALTPGEKHNHIWKAKAIEIGCDGKRCCKDFNTNKDYKYIYECKFGCAVKKHRACKFTKNSEKFICKKHRLKLYQIK